MKFSTSSSIKNCNTEENNNYKRTETKKAMSKTNICLAQGSQQKREKKKKKRPTSCFDKIFYHE